MVRRLGVGVLAMGSSDVGIDALLRRLESGQYFDGYDPTGSHDYQKGRKLADGTTVVLNMLAAGLPNADYGRLWQHYLQAHEVFLLIYRVDQPSTLAELKSVYQEYVLPRLPPALAVYVIATCSDLVPAYGSDTIDQGQKFATEYGLEFVALSAKSGEGCDDLEVAMVAAVVKAKISDGA